MVLICMRGYPASGKTTKAHQLEREIPGAMIVCRDDLRLMMFGPDYEPNGVAEDQVTTAEKSLVTGHLGAGNTVIVDACHVDPRYLRGWAKVATTFDVPFRVVDVPTDRRACLDRNAIRGSNGGRFVPEYVINRMAKRFPVKDWPVVGPRYFPKPEPYIADHDTPRAVICDIDGTLAFMQGRSPYDYSRVQEDGVHEDVADILQVLSKVGYYILLCSGRDSSCRAETMQWLTGNSITFDHLFMRDENAVDDRGNKLPDYHVKLDLFNKHIRNDYNVRFVLDDRDQVVKLWRDLGLRCWQVAPGDF